MRKGGTMSFPKKMVLAALVCFCGLTGFGAWWSQGPRRDIETLVVVANYKTTRLIADLIQAESRQPYLLLPAAESGDTRIYFCPPKTAAIEIPEAELAKFVQQANPRRLLIVGDERYVPRRTINQLGTEIPVFIVEGSDWQRNVDEIGHMLPLSNLGRNFEKNYAKLMEGRLYRPISAPAAKEGTVPSAE